LLAAFLLFVGTAALAYHRTVGGLETHIFRYINNWPDGLRPFFLVCTIVPESLWIAVAAVLVTFFLKLYRLSWQLAIATVGGFGVAYLAKHFIGRARPLEFMHGAQVRINESGMGFPSGHTMIITIVVLTLFPYLPRGWRWVIVLLLPLMALSRIYLGVHLPLDVIGGFAVGLGVVSFLRVLPKGLREKLRFD
jgi:undecaprenyl-diphosphatase